jgi:hypothetical protein
MNNQEMILQLTALYDKVQKYKSEAFVHVLPPDAFTLWSDFEIIRRALLQTGVKFFEEVKAVAMPVVPVDQEGKQIFTPADFDVLEEEIRRAVIYGSFLKG